MKLPALALLLAALALLLPAGRASAAVTVHHASAARIFCTSIYPPNPAWCP